MSRPLAREATDRDDVAHLARAWALAGRGQATCSPNPPVGCVLVRDGEVVGEGFHATAGGPHAEVVALAEAGDRARGATAYVTLEPCDHTGRTGPCSVALLEAGVARVVIAAEDPLEGAGGSRRLRAAGIVVDHDALDGWELALPERFLQRPWVTLKLALTEDGSTVAPSGRWITGEVARTRVHAQRAQHDAVLVGVGTVLADDPSLTVRHVEHDRPQPVPVVLDTHLRTPPDAVVVGRGAVIVAGPDARPRNRQWLEAAGAEVVTVPARGRLELAPAVSALAERGLRQLYAEPGPTLATALVEAGLVREVVLHRPGAGRSAGPLTRALEAWRHVRSMPLGEDREDAFRPGPDAPVRWVSAVRFEL